MLRGELCSSPACPAAAGPSSVPRPAVPTLGPFSSGGAVVMPPGPLPQTWGRFPKPGAEPAAPRAPRGCSDAGYLGTPPPPQHPSPKAAPIPGSPLRGAEGCCWQSRAVPGATAPGWPPPQKEVSPGCECPRAFDIPSPGTFFWGLERGTGPAPAGTSLPLRSCLHLEAPSKSYVGVDLPKREEQQTRRWDHSTAPAQFGYFWDF